MAQYAWFDSSKPDPKPILGWIDTSSLFYPSPPPEGNLLEVTASQWIARLSNIWAVSGGELVAVAENPLRLLMVQE